MGRLGKDAKNLLIGNDGSQNEPDDFKTELDNAIKKGVVTKSDGTLLITSRIKVDKFGDEITNNQEKDIKNINSRESYDTLEEELEAEKKKKEKEKEKERKRRQRENELARQLQSVGKDKIPVEKEGKEISDEKG